MEQIKKAELKGTLKGVIVILLLFGVFTGGIAYATVTITDENIWVGSSAVIVEGDYSTWAHKWTKTVPDTLYSDPNYINALIDEANDVISVIWYDDGLKGRLGTYKLSDFSIIYETPSGVDYAGGDHQDTAFAPATAVMSYGAAKSIQSYLLVSPLNEMDIDVWRAGGLLWTHNITTEVPDTKISGLKISLTGKYILIFTDNGKMILYEGS